MQVADLLVELGTEELPPGALTTLAEAFAQETLRQLEEAGLCQGGIRLFATPRRLAFRIEKVAAAQADRVVEKRGPALTAAYDDEGCPTPAARGFAQSLGLTVDDLETLENDKGAWLAARIQEQGRTLGELLPAMLEQSLQRLPIPRRMRWGARKAQFVRPAHWLVVLHGDQLIPMSLLEVSADRKTRGHRFMASGILTLQDANSYEECLESEGFVIANFMQRRERIRDQVTACGKALGAAARIDDALLDEVTALVEWPVALAGHFDEAFLRVPQEALITAMQSHQKYFPVLGADGKLCNAFITVSNIDSPQKDVVVQGNEKVIRPRLADAAFFYDNDCRKALAQHAETLSEVVFQQKLGSLHDKCGRVASLAASIAACIGGDLHRAQQAGTLAKADLATEMVGEFDTMQGVMGYYLAKHEGLDDEVAMALREQYLPRHAGDELPGTPTGMALAIADRLDTLTGIFGIGQKPTGDRDPFALRRAALGILRIIIERRLSVDLSALVSQAVALHGMAIGQDTLSEVMSFISGRYRAFYQERGFATPVILAVLAVAPGVPLDFDGRIRAVSAFRDRPEADALAAANKRVANILAKSHTVTDHEINDTLLQEAEERALAAAVLQAEAVTAPLIKEGKHAEALEELASLREPVDAFFDKVMVMSEDDGLRRNRLALLTRLRALFLQVADVSELG